MHWQKRLRYALIGSASLVSLITASAADLPQLKLEFVQPTGTVLATDDIAVVLRLTNLSSSQSFDFDASLPNAGLDPSLVPKEGFALDDSGVSGPFVSYSSFKLSRSYGCATSFTNPTGDGCIDGPPYSFAFADDPFKPVFHLAPGASFEYTLGSFHPVGGVAPAGSYEFYRTQVSLRAYGLDSAGHELTGRTALVSTCKSFSAADCDASGQSYFTRTVSAVPEPSSAALWLAGMAFLLSAGRFRTAGLSQKAKSR